MTVPVLFVPHSVQILTPVSTAWIDQIQDASLDEGLALFEESGSGSTEREYVAVNSREPILRFSTSDLGILTTVGFAGLRIYPGDAKPGLIMWGKAKTLGGMTDAIGTATHLKVSVTDGLLVPESISVNHKGVAKLTLALYPIKGAVPTYSQARPIIITKDQAITTGAGAVDILFTCGIARLAYAGPTVRLIEGLMDMAVDFGIQVVRESSDGELDPTHVCIMYRAPSMRFSTRDAELLADLTEDGKTSTAFGLYFQKVAANGTRTAKATAEHFSVVATTGILVPENGSFADKSPGTASYKFTPSADSGTQITLSAAAAIPTA